MRAGCHGFRVTAGSLNANSVVWSLPRITAPAARSRATHAASSRGAVSAKPRAPAVVLSPAAWMMSFSPTGTPWRGPRNRPSRASPSSRRAASRAPGRSTTTQAWTCSSQASMRPRQASTRSTAESRPRRIAAAASTTDSSKGAVTGRRPREGRRRARSRRAARPRRPRPGLAASASMSRPSAAARSGPNRRVASAVRSSRIASRPRSRIRLPPSGNRSATARPRTRRRHRGSLGITGRGARQGGRATCD